MWNVLLCMTTAACTWTLLHAQIDGTQYENSILVSSLMEGLSTARNVHINILPGTLYNANNITSAATLGLTTFNTRLLSLDVDYIRHRMYIFDSNTASIYALNNFDWKQNFGSTTLTTIHNGLSRYSVRVAVDWVSNNIYWTDPLFGWIAVQSASNTNAYNILLKDGLDKPYALAVDPVHKYIFWSDNGSRKKIERASLTGDGRQTVISTGLGYPRSIDIDHTDNKIVWVDSDRDTVETAKFDGTGRQVIRRSSSTTFNDVAVYKSVVGVTNTKDGSLRVFNKTTGAQTASLRKTSGDPFVAIALYNADVQPSQEDRCIYRGCSDICVNNIAGPVCLCREGYKLNGNGVSCTEDLGMFHRAFMWSNSSSICMMDIRSITSSEYVSSADCFFTGGSNIAHFDIDMTNRKVIFVERTEIFSINIGQTPVKQRLLSATDEITGISIDWREDNVYWCRGERNGTINLLSQATLMDVTLIDKNLTYPRDLNVIPFHDMMVWISGSYGAYKIERSNMNGSNREILIVSKYLMNPKGLIVDFSTNSLYFIDGTYVKCFVMESKELTTLAPTSSYYAPKIILTYKNYLAVADNSFTREIKIYEKISKPVLRFLLTSVNVARMTDMKVLDASLQPDQPGPCDVLNGDCEQICIPTGSNRTCLCEYGFQLDPSNKTCSSNLVNNNFLVVTDSTHNRISQISLANNDVRAVDTNTYGSPIGVVYNYKTKQMIWNTIDTVHKMFLNGTGYKEILNTEMLDYHVDRFAIDYSSGNIYYTANNVSSSGHIGVGILSPEGLNKRLIYNGLSPRDIVLDPEEGFLFWTDFGASPSFVKKAYMDGSNIMTVIQTGLTWPNGLAIDTQANLLYITDGGTNIIHRCTYNGVCINYYTDNDAHLMDIELLGDYLYYTAWNRQFVTKLHKTIPSLVSKVGYNPELGRLDSLSGYSSSWSSPPVSLTCSTNGGLGPCSTFCLPTPSGYTCGCEDGDSLLSDGKTCENAKTSTVSTKSTTTTPTTTTTSTTTTPTTTTTTPTTTTTTRTTTTTTPTTTTTTRTTTTTTPTTTTTTPTTTTTTPTTTTTTPTTTSTTPTTTTTTPTTTTTTPTTTTTTPTTTTTTPTTTTTTPKTTTTTPTTTTTTPTTTTTTPTTNTTTPTTTTTTPTTTTTTPTTTTTTPTTTTTTPKTTTTTPTTTTTTPTTTTTTPTTTTTTPTTTTTTPTTTTTTRTTTTTTPTTTTTTPTTTTTTPKTTTTTPTTTTTTPTTTTTTPTTTTTTPKTTTTTPTTTTTTPTTTTTTPTTTTTTPKTTTTTPTTTTTTPTTTTTTPTTTTTTPTTTTTTPTTTTTTSITTSTIPTQTSTTKSTKSFSRITTSTVTIFAIRTSTLIPRSSTPRLTITSKSTEFPAAAIAGVVAGFIVLIVIIVILVIVLFKRQRALLERETETTPEMGFEFESFANAEEEQRPESTNNMGEQVGTCTGDVAIKEDDSEVAKSSDEYVPPVSRTQPIPAVWISETQSTAKS